MTSCSTNVNMSDRLQLQGLIFSKMLYSSISSSRVLIIFPLWHCSLLPTFHNSPFIILMSSGTSGCLWLCCFTCDLCAFSLADSLPQNTGSASVCLDLKLGAFVQNCSARTKNEHRENVLYQVVLFFTFYVVLKQRLKVSGKLHLFDWLSWKNCESQ